MKLKYCLTGILCLFLKAYSQEIKPLTIGDTVPDVDIKNIYNYPASQSNLSAFKDKLVILDFMATNCGSCIKILPAFSALQKKYGDKIQIVMVTNQSAEKVKKFLQKHTGLHLPMVSGDSILFKLFPHTFISHEVWIKDGVVKAITHPEYVSAKNIEKVIADQKIAWPVKNDHVDAQASATKSTIINLYLRTYNIFRLPASHIILEVKDTGRFINNGMYKDEWKQKNTFCFDAAERSDLDKYFGLYGRMEKRKVTGYLLKKINTKIISPPANGISISIHNLIYTLNRNFYGLPFFNDTDEKQIINISEVSLKNIPLLKDDLKKCGLELLQEKREIKVLVISENKSFTPK